MKIVVFGPDQRVGAVHDGTIVDLSGAYAKYLHERDGQPHPIEVAEALVPWDLARFIEGGKRTLENAQKALDYLFGQAQDQKDPRGAALVSPATAVHIHAPRPRGTRIACAGSNFADHRNRMTARSGREERKPFIWGFWKVTRDPVASGGEVMYPERCNRLDYEGEVAMILGKSGKDIKAASLKDYVWGVTLFCDWSIRAPQEPLGPMNFAIPKNFDGSYSLGPCIVAGELIPPTSMSRPSSAASAASTSTPRT